MNKNLYIFIDESGNLDFSKNGTRHFVLTALVTEYPFEVSDALNRLKYDLIMRFAFDPIISFHATEDRQAVRNEVFDFIEKRKDISIYAVCNFKGMIPEELLENHLLFYHETCTKLIKLIFENVFIDQYDSIFFLVGLIMSHNQREQILKSLKQVIRASFQGQFSICFVRSSTDLNCQIADYCSWAIYVKMERNERRPFGKISEKVKLEECFFY